MVSHVGVENATWHIRARTAQVGPGEFMKLCDSRSMKGVWYDVSRWHRKFDSSVVDVASVQRSYVPNQDGRLQELH